MQIDLVVPDGYWLPGIQAELVVPDGFWPLVVTGDSRLPEMPAERVVPDDYRPQDCRYGSGGSRHAGELGYKSAEGTG